MLLYECRARYIAHIRYHALLVSLVPAVSYRSTKSALLFCCQQSSLLSVQTGRSSP